MTRSWDISNDGEQIVFRIGTSEYFLDEVTVDNVVEKLEANKQNIAKQDE